MNDCYKAVYSVDKNNNKGKSGENADNQPLLR